MEGGGVRFSSQHSPSDGAIGKCSVLSLLVVLYTGSVAQ